MLNNFCFDVFAQKWVFVIMSHVTCYMSHVTCDMSYVKCLCWSLGHAEQLLFSGLWSKVSISNNVTCDMSHFACHMSNCACGMVFCIVYWANLLAQKSEITVMIYLAMSFIVFYCTDHVSCLKQPYFLPWVSRIWYYLIWFSIGDTRENVFVWTHYVF